MSTFDNNNSNNNNNNRVDVVVEGVHSLAWSWGSKGKSSELDLVPCTSLPEYKSLSWH
jgi:hypothetical protein